MIVTPTFPRRHLAGVLATAMLAGAFAALTMPEVLATGRFGPNGPFLVAGLGVSGPVLALALFRRFPRRLPLAGLAFFLGLAGLVMPLAVLAARAGEPFGPARLAPAGVSLAGYWLTGVLYGLAIVSALSGALRHPRLRARPLLLGGLMILAGLAGVAFTRFVAGPRLSALNIALDLTLACAAVGIACAAGTPAASRRQETWLSVLALVAILALPLSGVLDERSRQWADPAAPPADQVRPAVPSPPPATNLP